MHRFHLKPQNMHQDSFSILSVAAERMLALRGLSLSAEDDAYTVTLTVDAALENDRYVISPAENGADLRAANDCALHAAFGRFLRECRFDGRGGFTPIPLGKTIDFTPKKPIRGMYFATHFMNFYHAAPLPKVYEVIEDLALRGCNNLLVWFDMHHFSSMEDPAAVALVERLHAILRYANRIGMGGSLTMLGNEAFADSPEHLRAEWAVQNGYFHEPEAHYHLELCPSKTGGIEAILCARRAMLEHFRDLKIDYVIYWPYDQGGCTCRDCAPWGANGFLKLLKPFKALIHEMLPSAEVVVSTWYFDRFVDGEWDGLYRALTSGEAEGISSLLAFFERGNIPKCIEENGLPQNLRLLSFPEISMHGCAPWGAYGASHLAAFLQGVHEESDDLYSGSFPYSEGIFEDANKFIRLMLDAGEYSNAFDALRAYVRHEFCCDDDALYEAILRTETALERTRDKTGEFIRVHIADPSDVSFVYETLDRYRAHLPERIAASTKFRLYYLRALIDREIAENDGYAIRSADCQDAMKEICQLYFVTGETHRWVKPPVGL